MTAAERSARLKTDREWLRLWRDVPAFLRSRGLCGQAIGLPTESGPAPVCALPKGHTTPCGKP